MNIYIYDDYLNKSKYSRILNRVEIRLTDLGLNGKIIRLGAIKNIRDVIQNEIKNGAKTIVAVGNNQTVNKIIGSVIDNELYGFFQKNILFSIILIGEDNSIANSLGIKKEELRRYEHQKDKLSHYSRKTIDLEYAYPFGFSELYGLAHRGDFDLSSHQKASGVNLTYLDPITNDRFLPHVLEPTFGLDRSILAAICPAYTEEKINDEERILLKFPIALAPIKIAVFPLLKNKPELVAKAKEIYLNLSENYMCEFDDNGNIGKRYRRQDEIGTPFCITIDFDTLNDNMVTIRNRDEMTQDRISISDLRPYLDKTGL